MLHCTEVSQQTDGVVGWDRGADRASNDADVSSILPIIPYGGFSPVRLEGWRIRRDLPGASISLSLLPACAGQRPVCLRPSCHGGKAAVRRPRVRERRGAELELASWQAIKDADLLSRWAFNRKRSFDRTLQGLW